MVSDPEFTRMKVMDVLACPIGNAHEKMRRLIVEHLDYQSRTRFWPRLDAFVLGKVTPNYIARYGLWPPMDCHAF